MLLPNFRRRSKFQTIGKRNSPPRREADEVEEGGRAIRKIHQPFLLERRKNRERKLGAKDPVGGDNGSLEIGLSISSTSRAGLFLPLSSLELRSTPPPHRSFPCSRNNPFSSFPPSLVGKRRREKNNNNNNTFEFSRLKPAFLLCLSDLLPAECWKNYITIPFPTKLYTRSHCTISVWILSKSKRISCWAVFLFRLPLRSTRSRPLFKKFSGTTRNETKERRTRHLCS